MTSKRHAPPLPLAHKHTRKHKPLSGALKNPSARPEDHPGWPPYNRHADTLHADTQTHTDAPGSHFEMIHTTRGSPRTATTSGSSTTVRPGSTVSMLGATTVNLPTGGGPLPSPAWALYRVRNHDGEPPASCEGTWGEAHGGHSTPQHTTAHHSTPQHTTAHHSTPQQAAQPPPQRRQKLRVAAGANTVATITVVKQMQPRPRKRERQPGVGTAGPKTQSGGRSRTGELHAVTRHGGGFLPRSTPS